MNSVFMEFLKMFGLLGGHQDMHLSSLVIAGMLLMLFASSMARMDGVWNCLIILREAVGGAGVMIRIVMNVVNLDILPGSVVCVLAHEAGVA